MFPTSERGDISRDEMLEEDRKERKLMETLMQLPDFDRYPLPEHFYAKYNIPKPKILGLFDSLRLRNQTDGAPGDGSKMEVRKPASGGIRPLIEVEPLKVEVVKEDEAPESEESK
jgi:hypothetical protein